MANETQNPNPLAPALAGNETPPPGNQTAARPDFLPEKFWDATKSAPNLESLAKSYTELEGKFGKGKDAFKAELEAERFKNRPEKPEAYAFAPPKDGPLAEGLAKSNVVIVDKVPDKQEAGKNYLVIDNTDPLMGFWRQHAHAQGLSPDQFSEGVAIFAQSLAARGQGVMSDDKLKAAVAKSYDTLGEHGVKRVEHVKGQLSAIVGEDGMKALDFDYLPAPAIAALEKVLEKSGGVKFSGQPAQTSEGLTHEQLKKLQASPEYRKGDPGTLKQVSEGYKRLYPGEQTPALGPLRR
jgi:hypothetical protein